MEEKTTLPNSSMDPKAKLPNSTAVLVLGICSILFSCLFVGIALGIIGIVLSGKGRKMYKEDPNLYDNYSQLNAGFITSIIGLSLGVLNIIIQLFFIGIFAAAAGTAPVAQ
jgi:hypothetical protein